MTLLRRRIRIASIAIKPIQWTWLHTLLLLLLLFLLPLFLLVALFLLSSQLFPFLVTLTLKLCFAFASMVVWLGLPTEATSTCLTLVTVL